METTDSGRVHDHKCRTCGNDLWCRSERGAISECMSLCYFCDDCEEARAVAAEAQAQADEAHDAQAYADTDGCAPMGR